MDTANLHSSYDEILPRANRLCTALSSELQHLLLRDEVTLGVPIETRVKEWTSIEEKINRKSLTLERITDLDDLVGLRLILLFRRDLNAVDRLLRQTLTIRSAEDISLRLAETQFGYQSQHYVVEVPDAWLKIPSYSELGGVRVEIQVRTLAQHIWAAASHKLQYKHEASVPLPLRRSIHRASALLETVDLEFDRLLQERSVYVDNQLKLEDSDLPLNVEILGLVLTELLPPQNKGATEPYDELLLDLNHFGVTTASKLRELLKKHKSAILAADASRAKILKTTHYYKHVGLTRFGLRSEFGLDAVNSFMDVRKKVISSKHLTKHTAH
jgi:putative GTP pyrophosphokinase